jgi:Zn-dependent protease with chaperone function
LFDLSTLIAAIENFVLFCTILSVVMFAAAAVVRQLAIKQLWRLRPDSLSRVYATCLVIPPVASLWLISAALLPRLWMTPEAFTAEHAAPFHEIHLLGTLTFAIEPGLAYAMLLFVAATAVFVAWSNVRGSWRIGRVINQLDMNAAAPPGKQVELVNQVAGKAGLSVGLVMSDYPLSFVWGFRRSKLVLSSGLLRTLSPAELTGVLAHEAAHHSRRDNLIKLLLCFCGYSSLAFLLSRLIVSWRATEVEMICDEVAATRTSEPLEIAEALVKLRRQTMAGEIRSDQIAKPAIASSFVSNTAITFERRVDRLLTMVDSSLPQATRPQLPSGVNGGVVLVAGSFLALSAVLMFAPLSIHHAAEALIEIFK